MIWATDNSWSSCYWLCRASPSLGEYSQSDYGIDYLVMSMSRVLSCVVGRRYLLWPVCSFGKTLLAFVLLHFVLQGQTCLLLQVSLDFLILHSNPLWWKEDFFFYVSSSRSSGDWVISWWALKTTSMNAYKQRQSKIASLSLVWALQWLIKTPILYMKTLAHI